MYFSKFTTVENSAATKKKPSKLFYKDHVTIVYSKDWKKYMKWEYHENFKAFVKWKFSQVFQFQKKNAL